MTQHFILSFAFVLILIGFLKILKVNVMQLPQEIASLRHKKSTMKQKITNAKGIGKKTGVSKLLSEMNYILENTERSTQYYGYLSMTMILAILGAFIGVILNNYFLMVTLFVTGAFSPLLYLRYTYNAYKKQYNEQVKTAIELTTTSYLRLNNILAAVEENITQIQSPIREVFDTFLAQNSYITSDLLSTISSMRDSVENDNFKDWCDALIMCQADSTKRDSLVLIKNRFTQVNILQEDNDDELSSPVSESILYLIIMVMVLPLLYVLNKTWFGMLFTNIQGKFVFALYLLSVFYLIVRIIRIQRPLDYKL